MPVVVDNPWAVQEWDFPRAGTPAEQLRFLVSYAVLAPSGHNTQPWRFRVSGNELGLFRDPTRRLPVADPVDRELLISCGAALFHLRTAIRHFGYEDVVHTFPDIDEPDLLAYVHLGGRREASLEDHRLLSGVKNRHTNRHPFSRRPVSERDLALIRQAGIEEGVQVRFYTEAEPKRMVADLVAEGDRVQGSDDRFRHELSSWVHANSSDHRDGLPGYVHGVGDLMSMAGPLIVRTFDWGGGQAAKDRQLAEGSPVLAVISSEADTPPDWLNVGEALARMLLTATVLGLSTSFLNQPVEVPSLRPRLADLVGHPCPQLVLRIGYGPQVRATPRRPVHEVLSRTRTP